MALRSGGGGLSSLLYSLQRLALSECPAATQPGNGLRSGRKVLRRALVGQRLVDYYPVDPIKSDPLMLNLKAESAKLKLDRLRRRGKAPPKKGAGKRAGKKK